jgi:hypothetical protein
MFDYITYRNQGATRSQPLDDGLAKRLGYLKNLGVSMEVFSGGQPTAEEGGPRTGSVRHDHGGAADAFFYKDGRKLDWANEADRPVFEQIVSQGKANGISGFGAGPGYMQQGSMHIGGGTPRVWGADGKSANAPEWLTNAYNGTAGAASPQNAMAQVQAKQIDPVAEVLAAGGNAQALGGSTGGSSAAPGAPAATADASKGLLGIDVPGLTGNKNLGGLLTLSQMAMQQPQVADDTPRGGLLASQPVQIVPMTSAKPTFKPWELSMFRGRA